MEASGSFSSYSPPASPLFSKASTSKSSGLTLVLPALKGGKPLKATAGGKKAKGRASSQSLFGGQDEERKAAPRPVKLKPLKEVLTKLIAQIKKKDDYAFFLQPVDASKVPGYSDVIKRPMDFRTMTTKVDRGKYRSLEEFAADIRLVAGNAKLFNPPGTIYHTEADRIETWALDHVQKASATVIQYETDWNIDVEKDEDGSINVDDEDDLNVGTPMDVDEPGPGGRSPSVASQTAQLWTGRRVTRAPQKKADKPSFPKHVTESVDEEGRLPGSKEGLGAFPPMSDWARTLVALKLKGKRYKKKERLRIEKEGPPMLADGSLDYTQMEDPFTVLSALVPEPFSRPFLTPLYPPLLNLPPPPPLPSSGEQTPVQPQAPPLRPLPPHLAPTTLLPTYSPSIPPLPPPPRMPSTTTAAAGKLPFSSTTTTTTTTASAAPASTRRHWTITRNVPRGKGKEKETQWSSSSSYLDGDLDADVPAWQQPREMHLVDQGSFALLNAALHEEMQRRGVVTAAGGAPLMPNQEDEREREMERVKEAVRESLDLDWERRRRRMDGFGAGAGAGAAGGGGGTGAGPEQGLSTLSILRAATSAAAAGSSGGEAVSRMKDYWSDKQAVNAEAYLRDVVYGGVDGYAYMRSLAEFCTSERSLAPCPGLDGLTLAQWVEREIVDDLTQGRHSALREASKLLRGHVPRPTLTETVSAVSSSSSGGAGDVRTQIAKSLYIYPAAAIALSTLMQIRGHKIDMGSLIKRPEELFLSEEEWAGKKVKERKRTLAIQAVLAGAVAGSEGPAGGGGLNSVTASALSGLHEPEGPEELSEVLEYVADLIVKINRGRQGEATVKQPIAAADGFVKAENGDAVLQGDVAAAEKDDEDPDLRHLRLNLLALAKRAPLDTIARLPKDLVPEHIRQYIPTLGTST